MFQTRSFSRRRTTSTSLRRRRPEAPSIERLESRAVFSVTTLQFQIPAHVANQGVQFGFWGTGETSSPSPTSYPQYMKSDHTFANLTTLPQNTKQLPLVSLCPSGTYTSTQTVSIPVPDVQNVSSGLVFFVGTVTNGIALNLDSDGNVLSVSTPTPGTAGGDTYGFFELNNTLTGAGSQLDVDVTTVDQFGIPFSVDFLKADGTTPITTMYPYNQGVGTLPGLDRASILQAFGAEHPAGDPFAICLSLGTISDVQTRLVSPRSLVTEPAYAGQLGTLATHFDDVLDEFFTYYRTNDFSYVQSQQSGPGYGTVWVGRTVTVSGAYTGQPVDPTNTFGIEALQLTGQSGVRGVTVNVNGNGNGTYTSAPTVTIGPPNQPNGVQATATAIMSGSSGHLSIAAIRIDDPGSGYTTVPTVSFSGGNGSGAAATAVISEFPGCVVNIYNPRSVQSNRSSLPSWMTGSVIPGVDWSNDSPSAMVFAGMDAFASNAVDPGVKNPVTGTANATYGPTLPVALGNIENVIDTALVRGIATMPSVTATSPADPSRPALLTPQQWLAGSSYQTLAWQADPAGQNLPGGALTPGATYYYAVTTVDPAGNETVPTRTVQTTLASHQNAAKLSWLALADTKLVDRYRIYRGTSPNDLRLVGEVANSSDPTTSFTDGTQASPPHAGAPLPYQFYAAGQTYDAYSKFLHDRFINGLGYGNPFDDQGNFSTNVEFPPDGQPPFTRIVINDWGATERFNVTGPTSATAGGSFLVTVTAEQGDLLSFSSSDPQAVLPASVSFDPATATFPIDLRTSGSQTVTMSDLTGHRAVLTVDVSPGTATKLGFVQQPQFTFTKRFFPQAVSVQVQDFYGNAVAGGGDQVSLAFKSATGATLMGTTKINTDATGLATFPRTGPTTGLRVNKPGNYALVASFTGGGLTAATSNTFSVSRVESMVLQAPAKATANVPFSITVKGPDINFQGTVTFAVAAGSNARVLGPGGVLVPLNGFTYTFRVVDKGTRDFLVSLGKTGKCTLTVKTSLAAQFNGVDVVTVQPAAPTRRVRR